MSLLQIFSMHNHEPSELPSSTKIISNERRFFPKTSVIHSYSLGNESISFIKGMTREISGFLFNLFF